MKRYYDRIAWSKETMKVVRLHRIFQVITYISLAVLFVYTFWNDIPYWVFLVVCILFICSLFSGHYGAGLRTLNWWKKRINKNYDAINEWTAAIDYDSDYIGLVITQPINVKRKSENQL